MRVKNKMLSKMKVKFKILLVIKEIEKFKESLYICFVENFIRFLYL